MAKVINPVETFEKLRRIIDFGKKYPLAFGTVISVNNYHNTTGLIMRSKGQNKKIGYCSENPKEVLETLMPDFYVTSYCGMEFYSSNDVEDAPMYGISVNEEHFEGIYGKRTIIDGKLSEILELDDEIFRRLKRKEPLTDKERLRIAGNISSYAHTTRTDIYEVRFKELMNFLTLRKRL